MLSHLLGRFSYFQAHQIFRLIFFILRVVINDVYYLRVKIASTNFLYIFATFVIFNKRHRVSVKITVIVGRQYRHVCRGLNGLNHCQPLRLQTMASVTKAPTTGSVVERRQHAVLTA